jgi:hypothetical protein
MAGPIQMVNWTKVITDHHNWAHAPDDGFDLITKAPASQQQLAELASRLGIILPKEIVSLYRTCNGFGVQSPNTPDMDSWFLVPVERVPEFTEQIRSWFRDTHPDVAARFFPFFDWANGDGMGYLFDADGNLQEGLYNFEHEEYERDENQGADEFLLSIDVSIEEFLEYR